MRVGIEAGGTFTDLVLIDGAALRVLKVPSTPASPERAVLDALNLAALDLPAVSDLVHGSTVATNAVLERKGARVMLVTTAGFRDLLWIQRQNRPRIYDLVYRKPAPVVARQHVIELSERIGSDGTVIEALDEHAARTLLSAAIATIQPDVVAVCLLNSFANAGHEQKVLDLIGAIAPALRVVCSHAVSPEFREYERCATTVLSAYVQPVVGGYLGRLQDGLNAGGFIGRLSVMQSNGGRLPAQAMQDNAVTALFSGPAAGVIGAIEVAGRSGFRDIITFDMGGTSTDVCLVSQGRPAIKAETEVDGLPVRTPVLDIGTVGAGGGSIVWCDDGGMLHVGPRSSGAMPGPACYGRGGTLPTITDAHVVRGTLRPERFLGGGMAIDREAALRAFEPLAAALGSTPLALADDAIRLANANVVHAIQRVSTEKGRDARDYALLAFGGAGPLHAARIAEELGIGTVIVPPHAGVLSALGLLASDYAVFETATHKILLDDERLPDIRAVLDTLRQRVMRRFAEVGISTAPAFSPSLQMRYVGQAFELDVEIGLHDLATTDATGLRARFQDAEAQQFHQAWTQRRPIEIVGFRLGAKAAGPAGEGIPAWVPGSRAVDGTCTVFEDRTSVTCGIVSWPEPGKQVTGPLVIDAETSTVFVPSSWDAVTDEGGNLIMTRRIARDA